jgi:hypothetical protein
MAPSEVQKLTFLQMVNLIRSRPDNNLSKEDAIELARRTVDPEKMRLAMEDLAARRAYFTGQSTTDAPEA